MDIIFYSTHCPKCMILEKKLQQKNISYEEINDIEIIQKKGFLTVPLLEVNGNVMDFKNAVDWINEQGDM